MNAQAVIWQYRQIISGTLTALIDSDYVYIDLPFYQNIGDTLIWEGTECVLESIPHKCLYKASCTTFVEQELSPDVVIVMQGGGNFGDIWKRHQEFRLKIIQEYPNNRIIILPQTVFYEDASSIKKDAEIMQRHKNLTICARDYVSYELLKQHNFSSNILLLPDMAFCIPPHALQVQHNPSENTLFVKRKDVELSEEYDYIASIKVNGELVISDWPVYENCQDKELNDFWTVEAENDPKNILKYATEILRPYLIKEGINFLARYSTIYTTRLHVAILGLLMGKEVHLFDNSYGKNHWFYSQWLSDVDSIEFINVNYPVSIVVPVYNSEDFLDECITSILAQSYTYFELILVNDGSTDKSGEICDHYQQKDKRVKVIHKANGGVSAARNAGINVATGEYIMFIDSDDWIEANSLTRFFANPDIPDITFFGSTFHYDDNTTTAYRLSNNTSTSRWEIQASVADLMTNPNHPDYLGFTWNKIFRTSIIKRNNILFMENLTLREDEVFTMNYITHCHSLGTLSDIFYHYRVRNTGLTASLKKSEEIKLLIYSFDQYLPNFTERNILSAVRSHIVNYYVHAIKSSKNRKERNRYINDLWEYKRYGDIHVFFRGKYRWMLKLRSPFWLKLYFRIRS